MKITGFSVSKVIFLFFVLFCFTVFSSPQPLQAQSYLLQDIVIGNPFDQINHLVEPQSANTFIQTIKNCTANARGGYFELHVAVNSSDDCQKVYQYNWTFDRDISTLNCGDKVMVNFANETSTEADCQDWTNFNPGNLALTSTSMRNGRAFENQLFSIKAPLHQTEGTASVSKPTDRQWQPANHFDLMVCPYGVVDHIRESGFSVILQGQDIAFEAKYTFQQNPRTLLPPPATSFYLPKPVFLPEASNEQQEAGFYIQVHDTIQGYLGRQVQLVVRFFGQDGEPLISNGTDKQYMDAAGFVAAGSRPIAVSADQFDLGNLNVWIPYQAFGLIENEGVKINRFNAVAELYADGKLAGYSQFVPLQVKW